MAMTRIEATLLGVAIGDALGMPAEGLRRAEVWARYGLIRSLHPAPRDHRLHRGAPAGQVTDDTHLTWLVAQTVIAGHGQYDWPHYWQRFVAWAESHPEVLGPSTQAALAEYRRHPEQLEQLQYPGDTNGLAMRISPLGIVYPRSRLDQLVEAVKTAARPTHVHPQAIAAAAAVAAVVSAGMDQERPQRALGWGIEVANNLDRELAGRLREAVRQADRLDDEGLLDYLDTVVGTGVRAMQSIPLAFAVAWHWRDAPSAAVSFAASLGGDSDTNAALVGAMLGAVQNPRWPPSWVTGVQKYLPGDLHQLARQLAACRASI